MHLHVTVDLSEVKALTARDLLPGKLQRNILQQVGAWYLRRSNQRINKGVDVFGRPFKQYSPAYLLLKHRAGRLEGRRHWLRLSGAMMQSRQVSVTGNPPVLRVVFTGSSLPVGFYVSGGRGYRKGEPLRPMVVRERPGAAVPNALKAMGTDKVRPHVGLNDKDLAAVGRLVRRLVDKSKPR